MPDMRLDENPSSGDQLLRANGETGAHNETNIRLSQLLEGA